MCSCMIVGLYTMSCLQWMLIFSYLWHTGTYATVPPSFPNKREPGPKAISARNVHVHFYCYVTVLLFMIFFVCKLILWLYYCGHNSFKSMTQIGYMHILYRSKQNHKWPAVYGSVHLFYRWSNPPRKGRFLAL